MTSRLVIGLAATALLWIATLWLFAWHWQRVVALGLRSGANFEAHQENLSKGQIMTLNFKRHSLGWSIFFLVFFGCLSIADFPIWQQLGTAFLLALCWGYTRIAMSSDHQKRQLGVFGPVRDPLWRMALASAEWLGYLGTLIFAANLALVLARAI